MARYTGPNCRLCRRVDEKLMLKGERCAGPKCAVQKRSMVSGRRRGGRPKKLSDYGVRLREKQKARYTYGVLEQQFRRLFAEAQKSPGKTGESLIQLLERRLDNTVYRAGFAESRNEARQLVLHGHLTVNKRRVNIPSFLVKPGDAIAWSERSLNKEPYKSALQGIESKVIPSWLNVDKSNLSGRVLSLPLAGEVGAKFDGKLIVEHYSR
ncbi:MAG: 30S ribosomal protein S4 [Chloroflexi bacterium]|nr:30S ribosomal protein S4 [Chloroflexota bacterium]